MMFIEYVMFWKNIFCHTKNVKKKNFFVKNSTVQEKSVYLTWYNKKMYSIYICVWLFGFT